MLITEISSDYNLRNLALCVVRELGKYVEGNILKVVIKGSLITINDTDMEIDRLSVNTFLRIQELKCCVQDRIPFPLTDITIDGSINRGILDSIKDLVAYMYSLVPKGVLIDSIYLPRDVITNYSSIGLYSLYIRSFHKGLVDCCILREDFKGFVKDRDFILL